MSSTQSTQGSSLMSSQKKFADVSRKEVENMGKAKFRKETVKSITT